MQDAFARSSELLSDAQESEAPTQDRDLMREAIEHFEFRLQARCFHSLVVFRQRIQLMHEMSNQLYLSHMQRQAHFLMKTWLSRALSRQNRRNRIKIADGYNRFRMTQLCFLGWKDVSR